MFIVKRSTDNRTALSPPMKRNRQHEMNYLQQMNIEQVKCSQL